MSDEQLRAACLKRDALHYLLASAYIEVRVADSLPAAKKFADIFHNLPMRLLRCVTSEDYDAEFLELLNRSKRYNMNTYMQELMLLADKVVSEEGFGDDRPRPESPRVP